MKTSWQSLGFVLIQFFSLGYIALTGPLFPTSNVLLLIELLGLALGIWAVLVMRIGNFNITPDPLKWSKLVMNGPYELIRHPMYLALLITTLPLVLNHLTWVRGLIWLILILGLLFKMDYEEGLLIDQLEGYRDYAGKSWKLIPFVY
ncbi:MAG: isoprenylcysteine carboxylmethyltransferase family protein [Chloroflexi bacterium]|nr:isoprenylcysteine carboxylmethyltransferase family protein [Chloroflexota bacterium]